MSFSFGFSGEDLNDEEMQIEESVPQVSQFENPLHSFQVDSKNLPQIVPVSETLESLIGNRFTFNEITIGDTTIRRREVFDIKHQLMMEDQQDSSESKELFDILIGDTNEDLKNQVYEGGLKSWECSIDAVEYLSHLQLNQGEQNFIELGCGTSLPLIYLFLQRLQSSSNHNISNFILSDFNKSVIRLVTIPNLLINWAKTVPQDQLTSLQRSVDDQIPIVEDEIEITSALIKLFEDDLESKRISFQFISGSWGQQFLGLLNLKKTVPNLIISSETIYSQKILPVIAETILHILDSSDNSIAVVTAKDIYFGVGGSVVEFTNYLNSRKLQGVKIEYEVTKLDSNLKRSIIRII